jgi:hypothetical protein
MVACVVPLILAVSLRVGFVSLLIAPGLHPQSIGQGVPWQGGVRRVELSAIAGDPVEPWMCGRYPRRCLE